MRVQFDIEAVLWSRMKRYVSDPKMRHCIARDALEEWITRHEGRDKKYRMERLFADAEILKPVIQKMIDDGQIKL